MIHSHKSIQAYQICTRQKKRGDSIRMKRVLSDLLIVSFTLSMFTTPTRSYAKNSYRYAKTTVNVRKKPNTKSKIVGRLHWNDRIKIIRKVNQEWVLVKYKKKARYVCSQYLKKSRCQYIVYSSPSANSFKSYEDADCITDSQGLAQGRLKRRYHLDDQSGVWMVGNRYCVAIGSYFTRKIGIKVDLVLSYRGKTHILKCITADCKADKDTVNQHRVHSDGSLAEFVVKTSMLSRQARLMGDVSFTGKQFRGRIVKIRVYCQRLFETFKSKKEEQCHLHYSFWFNCVIQ